MLSALAAIQSFDAVPHTMLPLHVQTSMVDAELIFEPPNYLINTNSKIEWWAVADPPRGLAECGLEHYPKEQRVGSPNRKLYSPDDYQDRRNAMNDKLAAVGEPPLQLPGFISLRLYTGPRLYLDLMNLDQP